MELRLWESLQIFSELFPSDLCCFERRDFSHEVLNLLQSNFHVASDHSTVIICLSCKYLCFSRDSLERLLTRDLQELIDLFLAESVAVNSDGDVCTENVASSWW